MYNKQRCLALLLALRNQIQGCPQEEQATKLLLDLQKVIAGEPATHTDPRHPSARSHSPEGEPTTAVWLTVHQDETKEYYCKFVRVIGEEEAGGKHVAYVAQPGNETIVLATGYNGNDHQFDERIRHPAKSELVIDGKFDPPNLGPLAIFLERDVQIISDVVGSLGLPRGHHVCYEIVFDRRNP